MDKNNQQAKELLERYKQGLCTPEEIRLLQSTLLEFTDAAQVPEAATLEEGREQVLAKLQPEAITRTSYTWLYAAAALLFIAAIGLLYRHQVTDYFNPAQQITISTSKGERKELTLPDGSRVWLNGGTTLSYPQLFKGDKRDVTLTDGQAFFEVATDKSKPFTVSAGILSVAVLGTTFEITAFTGTAQAGVAVQSGSVSVQAKGNQISQSPTIIIANQKATVNTATGRVITSEIAATDIAGWKDSRLTFVADDFANVIEALQRRYNVRFNVQSPKLYNEKITLRLDDQPLQGVLQVLTLNNLFSYQFANDSTVVIK